MPANFAITPATLTLTGSRTYDGTVVMNGSSMQVSGVNGETFVVSGSANSTTKNVVFDSNSQITSQALQDVIGLTLTGNAGAALSNYSSLTTANTQVTITKRPLTLTAPSINKVYDGAYSYSMTTADYTNMSNLLVGGDTVTSASVAFAGNNPNVGSNKVVNLLSATISDGNSGSNYNVSLANSNNSQISPAPLTVTAVSSAKFVTQTDPSGYGGALYNGFVNGENSSVLSGSLSIARSNSSSNTAGSYVLTPSGFGAAGSTNGNYQIAYQTGTFTIVPAQTLLLTVAPTTTVYGSVPTYSITAQYLFTDTGPVFYLGGTGTAPSSNVITLTTNSSTPITVNDGAASTATFTVAPVSPAYSSSNNLVVGAYNLSAANTSRTGSNFVGLMLVGSSTVNPLTLSANQLGLTGISRVYNGSNAITGVTINTIPAQSSVLAGDSVSVLGTGTFDNANVGTSKTITVNISLNGTDASNYVLSSNQLTSNTGTITQLPSVTYVGASGGSWSNASNWTGGAIPTLGNVANVVIPAGITVNYDSDSLVNQIPTSTITDNGVIAFTGANNFTFANNVSGLGSINQSGTGVLTISGDNSYSGGALINSSSLVVGSSTGLGTGTVISSGGILSTASGITLSSLTVNGPVTIASDITTTGNQTYSSSVTFAGNVNSSGNLTVNGAATVGGNITTTGNQTYNGAVTLSGSGAWTPALWDLLNPTVTLTNARPSSGIGNTLTSSGANITFNDTLLASNQQSLSINASSGVVTFGNSVGNSSQINGGSQNPLYATYDKSRNMNNLFINASRILIKANIATVGDQILKGAILVGDNGQNGLTRTLLSADPSIQLIGTVDDAADSTHNLILYVISAPGGATPTLNIGGPVGSLMPLASLDWIVGRQNTTSYLADISGTTPVGSVTNSSTIITVETIKADAAIAAAKAAAASRAANSNNTLAVQTFMQQAISNMGSFSMSRPSGVSVSSPQGVTIERPSSSSTSSGTQIGESKSATSQASANATLMPPSTVAEPSASSTPRQIMVQIQTAQGIELVPRSQVSSDSGLNFRVPTAVLTTLQVSPAASNVGDAKAPVLFATLADGSALPSWIQFDPQTQTFTATQIPSDVKSVTIKLQSKQGQEIIGESVLTLSAN